MSNANVHDLLFTCFTHTFFLSFFLLSFRQSKWLAGFIQSNNERRAAAASKTKKNFYKLVCIRPSVRLFHVFCV